MKAAKLKSKMQADLTKEMQNREALEFELPTSRWALLLEDDPAQFNTVKDFLEKSIRSAIDRVVLAKTESEFVRILDEVKSEPDRQPKFVVSDVMMPWTSIDELAKNPQPADVREGTFQRAGIRCWKKFREIEATRRTPWVFFTVLDENHVMADDDEWDRYTGYVKKSDPLTALDDAITEFAELDQVWIEPDELEDERFRFSLDLRRVLLEGLGEPLGNCVPSPTG